MGAIPTYAFPGAGPADKMTATQYTTVFLTNGREITDVSKLVEHADGRIDIHTRGRGYHVASPEDIDWPKTRESEVYEI